jgi:hypothetical protein
MEKALMAGGVAQVEEHLPSKHKALNSNPRTKKSCFFQKKKKKGIISVELAVPVAK